MADSKPKASKAKDPKKPSATQTEMQALRGSGRSKIVLLAAVLVVALAAAAYSLLADGGSGNPENPGKVLVVTTDGGKKAFLMNLGFEADAQTFENLESKAKQEVPDLEENGVLAILALADRFGYGYVVFERPYNYEFGGLEVRGGLPKLNEGDRYAVVSVGDLAKPHRELTRGAMMLPALFEHARLAELVPPKQPPTVEAVQLRDQLRDAIDELTDPRLPMFRY